LKLDFLYRCDAPDWRHDQQDEKEGAEHPQRHAVYFSIDDEYIPYKGVKGNATLTIVEDPEKTVPIVEKVNLKYPGRLHHPIVKMLIANARNGIEILLKISPRFFSTRDFGKAQ
jgi:hypothetical protein